MPSRAQMRDDRALQLGPLWELVDVRRDPLEHESQDLRVTIGAFTDDPKTSLEANDVGALVEVLRELIVEKPRVAHANAPGRFRKVRRKEFLRPAERRIAGLRRERTAFRYVDAERGTLLESREIELEPPERVDHSTEVQRQPRTCPKPAVPEKAPVARQVASEIGEGRPGDVVRYAPSVVPRAHVAERRQEQIHIKEAARCAELRREVGPPKRLDPAEVAHEGVVGVLEQPPDLWVLRGRRPALDDLGGVRLIDGESREDRRKLRAVRKAKAMRRRPDRIKHLQPRPVLVTKLRRTGRADGPHAMTMASR